RLFSRAVSEVYESLIQEVYGNREKNAEFLRAIGSHNLSRLKRNAIPPAVAGFERMETTLRSVMREVRGNDGLAFVELWGESRPVLVLDPSEADYSSAHSLEYVVEDVDGGRKHPVVRSDTDSYEVLGVKILRNTNNNDLLLVKEGVPGRHGRMWGRLRREDSLFDIQSHLMGLSGSRDDRPYPPGNYQEYRLVRFKSNQQFGIELALPPQGQHLKSLKPVIQEMMASSGAEADFNRSVLSLFTSDKESSRDQGYHQILTRLNQVDDRALKEAEVKDNSFGNNDVKKYHLKDGLTIIVKDFGGYEALNSDDKREQRYDAAKEVFASLFDQKLKLGVVPPTSLLKGADNKVVAFFVPDGLTTDPEGGGSTHYKNLMGLERSSSPILVLDFIFNTQDRGDFRNFIA
ncbi:MAG: hypothetical protein ACPG5T_09485, partial [Endozoicomonas sp.]